MTSTKRLLQLDQAQNRSRQRRATQIGRERSTALERYERWFRDTSIKQLFAKKIGLRDLFKASILDQVPAEYGNRKQWVHAEVHAIRRLVYEGRRTEAHLRVAEFRKRMLAIGELSPRVEGVVLEVLRDVGRPVVGRSADQVFLEQEAASTTVIRHWVRYTDFLRAAFAAMCLCELHWSNIGTTVKASLNIALECTEFASRLLEHPKTDRRVRLLRYHALATRTRLLGFEAHNPNLAVKHFPRVLQLAADVEYASLEQEAKLIEAGLYTRLDHLDRFGCHKSLDRAAVILGDLASSYAALDISPYRTAGLTVRELEVWHRMGKVPDDHPGLQEMIDQWRLSPSTHRRRLWSKWSKQEFQPLALPFLGIPPAFLYDEFGEWLD